MNRRIGSPAFGSRPGARTLGAPAPPPAAAAGGQKTRRPKAGTTVPLVPALLGTLLLAGCSAVGQPGPACRALEVSELPLLGGIRGAWIDDERFVLADLHQVRLLAYSTSGGRVRIVNGWESDDAELNFWSPVDIEPWGDGFVVADAGTMAHHRLLELDATLRPVDVLWESDVKRVDDRWVGKELAYINRLLASGDRLYLQAGRFEGSEEAEEVYAEFGLIRESGQRSASLSEQTAWPTPARERVYHGQRLAATVGADASAFLLRYLGTPFIQRLAGEEEERLAAFPEVPAPLPELPSVRDSQEIAAYYAALEASSYPAGLFGDEDSLYVLMRDATGEETVWDLHRIDPERDEVVGVLRLPTTATHVSLLPGSKYWLLEESSSQLKDYFRAPTRLLLLSSAAIRAGEVPPCD